MKANCAPWKVPGADDKDFGAGVLARSITCWNETGLAQVSYLKKHVDRDVWRTNLKKAKREKERRFLNGASSDDEDEPCWLYVGVH